MYIHNIGTVWSNKVITYQQMHQKGFYVKGQEKKTEHDNTWFTYASYKGCYSFVSKMKTNESVQ